MSSFKLGLCRAFRRSAPLPHEWLLPRSILAAARWSPRHPCNLQFVIPLATFAVTAFIGFATTFAAPDPRPRPHSSLRTCNLIPPKGANRHGEVAPPMTMSLDLPAPQLRSQLRRQRWAFNVRALKPANAFSRRLSPGVSPERLRSLFREDAVIFALLVPRPANSFISSACLNVSNSFRRDMVLVVGIPFMMTRPRVDDSRGLSSPADCGLAWYGHSNRSL